MDNARRRRPAVSSTLPTVAAFASGALVMGLAGAIVGGFLSASTKDLGPAFGIGLGGVIGVVAGLLVGKRIASCDSILGGAAAGAFFPIALVLVGAIRSGRIADMKAEDFQQPLLWVGISAVMAVGGSLGALLVGVKKVIVWTFAQPAESEVG